MNNEIKIRGARTHNLKNINLDIPREKLVVLTGLSPRMHKELLARGIRVGKDRVRKLMQQHGIRAKCKNY